MDYKLQWKWVHLLSVKEQPILCVYEVDYGDYFDETVRWKNYGYVPVDLSFSYSFGFYTQTDWFEWYSKYQYSTF